MMKCERCKYLNDEALKMELEIDRLREWKRCVLGKCKASDGFDRLDWAGDKNGWGFVHYFIGHLETRALEAEKENAQLRTALQSPTLVGANIVYRPVRKGRKNRK